MKKSMLLLALVLIGAKSFAGETNGVLPLGEFQSSGSQGSDKAQFADEKGLFKSAPIISVHSDANGAKITVEGAGEAANKVTIVADISDIKAHKSDGGMSASTFAVLSKMTFLIGEKTVTAPDSAGNGSCLGNNCQFTLKTEANGRTYIMLLMMWISPRDNSIHINGVKSLLDREAGKLIPLNQFKGHARRQ